MKQILYSKVEGRRTGDTTTKWKFDWYKAIATALVSALIIWGAWISRCAYSAKYTAKSAKSKIDYQTTVLHNRITGEELEREVAIRRMNDELEDVQDDIIDHLIKLQSDLIVTLGLRLHEERIEKQLKQEGER